MNRRQFLGGVVVASVASGGCLSGDESNGNGSGNGSGENGSDNGGSGDGSGGEGGTTTVAEANAFGEQANFDGRKLFIPINREANVNKVEIVDPNGQQFATYNLQNRETSAEFTLIESGSGMTDYKKYPFGDYTIYALRNGEAVADTSLNLQPNFRATGVSHNDYGTISITFKNEGTGPAPIRAARIYKADSNPNSDEGLTLGTVNYQPKIVPPGGTITVPANPFGFNDGYGAGASETPTSTGEQLCSGETRSAVIDYKMFGSITGGQQVEVTFAGGRASDTSVAGINCVEISLANSSSGSSSTSNTTGSS